MGVFVFFVRRIPSCGVLGDVECMLVGVSFI